MRLVPILRDAGVRESAGDPVRVDAILPRPPERREATDGGRPGLRAAVDRRPGARADPPRERDERAGLVGAIVDGTPDDSIAAPASVSPSPPIREGLQSTGLSWFVDTTPVWRKLRNSGTRHRTRDGMYRQDGF